MGTSGNLPPGTLILGGTNAYNGGTNVLAGCLVFANSYSLPTRGKITLGSGAYVAAGFEATASTFLDGVAPLFRAGFNASTAEGVIGFEGGTDGPINLTGFDDAVRFGARTGTTVTLTASNTITPPGSTYRLGGGRHPHRRQALSDSGSGARNVDVGTGGDLAAGMVVLAGANTYSGTATVSAGTLQVGSNSGLGSASASVTSPMAHPRLANLFSHAFRGPVGQRHDHRSGGRHHYRVAVQSAAGHDSAALAGSGSLIKSTTGAVTLAGLSTYTGVTTLSGGTLAVTSMADGGEPVRSARPRPLRETWFSTAESSTMSTTPRPAATASSPSRPTAERSWSPATAD